MTIKILSPDQIDGDTKTQMERQSFSQGHGWVSAGLSEDRPGPFAQGLEGNPGKREETVHRAALCLYIPSLQMKKPRLGTSDRSRFQPQVVCSQIQLLFPAPLVAKYGDLES